MTEDLVPNPGRTPWDDVQDLMASIGHEVRFEPTLVPRPPLVCEPMTEYAWDDEGTAWTYCRVHLDESWPCTAFREGRGVTPQDPHWVNQLVTRPIVGGQSFSVADPADFVFTEREGDDD